MFGISRGFWRLSAAVGFVGVIGVLMMFDIPLASMAAGGTLTFVAFVVLWYAALPAFIVLVIGWVVAGFRHPN